MNIGINASFVRKPGTGIGMVTLNFLRALREREMSSPTGHTFFLYFEEDPLLPFDLPEQFKIRAFLPLWKRDDLIRKTRWEKTLLPKKAAADGCEAFLSLYQCPTVFESPIRHVMVVHDIIPKLFPEYLNNWRKKRYWNLTEKGIAQADHIIAVSEHTKENMSEALPLSDKDILVAHPSVSVAFSSLPGEEATRSVLEKYGLAEGYLYSGGGFETRKNMDLLLRAYAALLERQRAGGPYALQTPDLVLSGALHPELAPLVTDAEALVRELSIEGNVKLLGFVPEEDLPPLYRGASVFVYPSKHEGFGLPLLEAMNMGTPVLASDSSAIPEVGSDAVAYFKTNDQEALTDGMESLLSDATRRKDLSLRGIERAKQFSNAHIVEAFLGLLS